MSSNTPIRRSEASPNILHRELATPPKFKLKKPNESWDQIIRKAVTLRPKSSLTFNVREIYGRVIETYPYFRMENPEVVLNNIRNALGKSDFFKSTGEVDSWTVEETFEGSIHRANNTQSEKVGADIDKSTFKIPTSYTFSPIRESNTNLRPLIPNTRQILPSMDPFGPPKLAPLLPSSPTSPITNRRTSREKEYNVKVLSPKTGSGFSPMRSLTGIADIFMKDAYSGHDSDTEDEDWKSLGPEGLFFKKKVPHFPMEQLVPSTPSKRANMNSDASHSNFPPTPVTPNPSGWVKSADILPTTTAKMTSQDDDEDTDDENWAQMDLTPKRKSTNSCLESHTPMKKALHDINHVGDHLSNDKILALEALALLCSPNRDSISTDTERHVDVRQTAISL